MSHIPISDGKKTISKILTYFVFYFFYFCGVYISVFLVFVILGDDDDMGSVLCLCGDVYDDYRSAEEGSG